jgi:hypothetical protein
MHIATDILILHTEIIVVPNYNKSHSLLDALHPLTCSVEYWNCFILNINIPIPHRTKFFTHNSIV